MAERTVENILCTPLVDEAKKLFPDANIVTVTNRGRKISRNDNDLIIDLIPENNPRSPWLRYLYMSSVPPDNLNVPNYFSGIHYSDIALCAAGYFKQTRTFNAVRDNSPVLVTDDINEATKNSFLDKRVIYISSDDNFMYAPYGQGHFVVRARRNNTLGHKAHSGLNPGVVDKNKLEKLFSNVDKDKILNIGVDVWVSRFDRAGFLEYVPFTPMDLTRDELLKWIYRTTWKSTINRNVIVGDPQRFLTVGEKYIDRILDIDKEVEDLYTKVLTRYSSAGVIKEIKSLENLCLRLEELKKLSFEGIKSAKELLASSAVGGQNANTAGVINIPSDNKIFAVREKEISPLFEFFKVSRAGENSKDIFPVLKNIVISYEDLFSRTSFMHELIVGLMKRVGEEIYG